MLQPMTPPPMMTIRLVAGTCMGDGLLWWRRLRPRRGSWRHCAMRRRNRTSGMAAPCPYFNGYRLRGEEQSWTKRSGGWRRNAHRARRTRRQARGTHGADRHVGAVHHAPDPLLRGAGRGRPRADRAQRRHHPRRDRHRLPRRPGGAGDLERPPGATWKPSACAFRRGMCREIIQASAPPSSPSTRAIRSATCSSAARTRCSRRPTARPSSATSTTAAATAPSRTSATS